MWKFLRYFFFGVHTEAEPKTWANVATPDQLIAARIVESIAKNFHDWKVTGSPDDKKYIVNYTRVSVHSTNDNSAVVVKAEAERTEQFTLTNRKLKITVKFPRRVSQEHPDYIYHSDGGYYFLVSKQTGECKVNDVLIDPALGTRIVTSYKQVKAALDKAKEVAAEALRKQKEENDKWNLAEQVFGIKRDGFGRPIFPQYEGNE